MDTTKSSATARPPKVSELERLEDHYRHEVMDDEERQELRDQVIRLRRRLGL